MTDKQFQELSERLYRIGNMLQNINGTLSQIYIGFVFACILGATAFFVAAIVR